MNALLSGTSRVVTLFSRDSMIIIDHPTFSFRYTRNRYLGRGEPTSRTRIWPQITMHSFIIPIQNVQCAPCNSSEGNNCSMTIPSSNKHGCFLHHLMVDGNEDWILIGESQDKDRNSTVRGPRFVQNVLRSSARLKLRRIERWEKFRKIPKVVQSAMDGIQRKARAPVIGRAGYTTPTGINQHSLSTPSFLDIFHPLKPRPIVNEEADDDERKRGEVTRDSTAPMECRGKEEKSKEGAAVNIASRARHLEAGPQGIELPLRGGSGVPLPSQGSVSKYLSIVPLSESTPRFSWKP